MSYNIKLTAHIQSVEFPSIDWDYEIHLEANTTYNLCDMIIAATGIEDWGNDSSWRAVEVIDKILIGYNNLRTHPEDYKRYEASNGWGTVEGCEIFFRHILQEWADVEDKIKPCLMFEVC